MDRREHHAPSDSPRAGARRQLSARADGFLTRNADGALRLAALLILAVGVAWVVSKATGLLPHATARTAHEAYLRHHGPLRQAALAVAHLGDPGVALLIVVSMSLYCGLRRGVRAAVLPWAAVAVIAFTTVAKNLPGRATSLPSGHAAYATAIGGLAGWLLLRAGHPWWAGVPVLLGLAMAPARVVEGAHTWPDVVAGVVLGAAWLIGVLVLVRAWTLRPAVSV